MIDHVLGRPSTQFRKIQVLAVLAFWSLYLLKGNNHGPPGLRNLSIRLRNRLTPWQTMVVTLLWLYVARNFSKIMGFESPEPLANLYSRSYFRATWITTALDAGFWTAMKIKPQWLQDMASMAFSAYYLIAAEQADEKVRRVRATLTVEHLRVSWNKATTPYLSLLNRLVRPRFTKYAPRQIRIARPQESSYREPVNAWLYFDGSLAELREQSRLVLDIPGGGYVAMNPRTADDKLLAWAGRTGVPILSLDYRKAPEYPYPYALNECFDVYRSIVASRGRCAGLSGHRRPHIVISGDSAGGNLATGMTIMALQYGRTETRKWMGETTLPAPDGLILIYPSLDMNIGSWMTEEQMSLIQDRGMRKTNENILRRKSEDYNRLTPKTSVSFLHNLSGQKEEQQAPATSSKDYFSSRPQSGKKTDKSTVTEKKSSIVSKQTPQIKTRIAVSSMISYFGDRVLTPEMMRAMIILYIGPHNRPDFKTEYLLSPILAPDAVLAVFPKTYFITGERDPLVDDTVIFAGRLRQAKLHRFRERQELALEKSKVEFNEKDHVEVNLIPGISHGFLNFPGIFPDGWKHIHKCAKWITDLLAMAEERDASVSASSGLVASSSSLVASHMSQDAAAITGSQVETGEQQQQQEVSRRASLAESSADDDHPLEMSLSRITPIKNGTTQKPASAECRGSHSNSNIKKGLSKLNSHNPSSTTSSPSADRSLQLKPAPFTLQLPPLKKAQNLSSSSCSPSSPSSSAAAAAAAAYRPQSAKTKTTKQTSSNHVLSSSLQNSLNTERESDNENDDARSAASDNGKTFTRLPSEEDLIGRRMNGLAGGLMGLGEGVRTP